MADIIAGIAPRVDTHTNWTSLNPTLGKDDSGKSYGQIIISTGAPEGDVMVWGNAQTYNVAYASGQYMPAGEDVTFNDATVSGQFTVGYVNSKTVTASATLGSESVLNVNTGTATITIPSGLPIGTRKTIRKISGSAGTVTIARSGSDVFTRASLTSVTLTSDGDFWVLEKVTATRWELVDGVESGSGYYKYPDGSVLINGINTITSASSSGAVSVPLPLTVQNTTYSISVTPTGSTSSTDTTVKTSSIATTSFSVVATLNNAYVDIIVHWQIQGAIWY